MTVSDFNIERLRGSLFAPQINFDWDFVHHLQSLLGDYIPSYVFDTPQVINGVLLSPGEWVLMAPDNKEMIIFQTQKIDLITNNVNTIFSKDIIYSHAEKCEHVFEAVLIRKGVKANRLALAPTLKYIGIDAPYKDFANSIFAKKTFRKYSVENCDFSQVFRIEEKINGMDYKVNYLSKFYTASSVVKNKGVNSIKDVRIIDFDINTFPNSQYSFDVLSVKDFFAKATDFCSNFFEWYCE